VSGHAVDWDAATYDRVADPQEQWGREVLSRFHLKGDETVLDAGCGSGRVTKLIFDLVPDGRVVGVDGAPSMVEVAREQLAPFGDRVELIVSDLLELELDEVADALFSNATFHWILDHERLFQRLFAALRPGGVMETQCGGEGNVAEWIRAIESAEGDERFSPYLRGMPDTHNFASVGDTRNRLERAGFELTGNGVWLERKTVQPKDPETFSRVVGLAKHMARLPDALKDDFAAAVLGSMPRPLTLEYVRLNISAVKPA
jgi:trans-aconitate 2-methyltransferase